MNRRWIFVALLFAAIPAMVALWLIFKPVEPGDSLAAGLHFVELMDSVGVERVERALTQSGHTDEATLLRCSWLARRNRYDEVLRQLPRRLENSPWRQDVLRLVGTSQFHLGELQQAEVALTTLVSEFPDELEAYRLLGAMYYDLGSNALALKALAHVQRLAPGDYRPHQLAAIILADAEKFQEAIQELRFALDKHPPEQAESPIRRDLAKSLIHIHDYQGAITVLEPDAPSTQRSSLLAECHWSLGNKNQAMREIESALIQSPTDPQSLRIKVRLVEDQGKLDIAIELLRQILSVEPYDVESRYQLVQLLGIQGKTEQRDQEQAEYVRYRKLQDRLVELNLKASEAPDALEPRRELVQVCRDLGRLELAEMWSRAARFCEMRNNALQKSERNDQSPEK